jgi:hypothetical protein
MKNRELKIKNEDEDRKLGNEDCPMFTGGWAGRGQGGVRNAERGMNQEGDPPRQGEAGKFEDLRLKVRFWVEEHAKAWTPYGECAPPRPPSLPTARQASFQCLADCQSALPGWRIGNCSLIPTVSHLVPHFSHKNIFASASGCRKRFWPGKSGKCLKVAKVT